MTDTSPVSQESSTPKVGCECIQKVHEAWIREGSNTEIVTALVYNPISDALPDDDVRISVPTRKRDSRSRSRADILIARFCPLCGKRYIPEALADASRPPAAGGV